MSDGVTIKALAGLPPAQVIEELDYQTIVNRRVSMFDGLWAAERAIDPTLPLIDTMHLPSEPGRKLIEEAAYAELNLRARINDAGRSNLLFYSEGSDTDHLVIFHDVIRMGGEEEDPLKSRTILAIAGRSTGGPRERYMAIARGADVRVRHAEPYRIGRDPTIHMAVYSTDNDGVADDALLAKVRAALESPRVGLINDVFNVRAAVFRVVDVVANVWLLPDTPVTALDAMKGVLRRAWSAETGLGFDFVPEWAQARLMIAGVQRAQVVTEAVVAQPYEALSIGTITLINRGRSY